jgi:hypothetical protein
MHVGLQNPRSGFRHCARRLAPANRPLAVGVGPRARVRIGALRQPSTRPCVSLHKFSHIFIIHNLIHKCSMEGDCVPFCSLSHVRSTQLAKQLRCFVSQALRADSVSTAPFVLRLCRTRGPTRLGNTVAQHSLSPLRGSRSQNAEGVLQVSLRDADRP